MDNLTHILTYHTIKGNHEEVKGLLNIGMNPDVRSDSGDALISIASRHGHYLTAEALLEHGASVCVDDFPPLIEAAKYGYKDVAKLLLRSGAYVNLRTKNGDTPLIYACRGGHKEMAKLLLQYDADPNMGNIDGVTPRTAAMQAGYKDTADFLQYEGVWRSSS